jgi:hypothetical protein
MADAADVRNAQADCTADRVCRFTVAIRHADTGWKHYADRFEVLGPDDRVIATRVLRHPHVHEQPFIRTLEDVVIPEAIDEVTVRAHDSVHGFAGREVKVKIRPALATDPAGDASQPASQPAGEADGAPGEG